VDSKDFQLLVALYEDPRRSFRELARRVKLSHPVVRERVRDLESRGILQGYFLLINPSVFGREDLLVRFKGELTHADAVKALAVPDVVWVAWKLDGGLTVQVWPRDRALTVKALANVVGASPSAQFSPEPRQLPRPLSLIDWQIVEVLVEDPLLSLKDLEARTGLSPKTIRNHLTRLLRERTISISPKFGSLADSGELVYTFSVFGDLSMSELHRIITDAYLIRQFREPPAKHLLCRGSDLTEVIAKTQAIGKLPGVKSVSVSLNREQLVATNFVRSLVREKIGKFQNANNPSPIK
jgi:DNA-binding Lrp family transcriptional regulator